MTEERQIIERMLSEGKITGEEAEDLFSALDQSYGYEELEEEELLESESSSNKTSDNSQQRKVDKEDKGLHFEINFDSIIDTVSNLFNDFLGTKHTFTEIYQGEFSADIPYIHLDNVNGELAVKGWNEDGYKLKIKYKVNAADQAGAKMIKDKTVNFIKEPDRIEMIIGSKSRFKIKSDLELFLPKNKVYNVKIINVNGNVIVTELNLNKGYMSTVNGTIKGRNYLAKNLEVKTVNGLVNLQGGAEMSWVSVKNGNIEIEPKILKYSELDISNINGNGKVYLVKGTPCYLEGKTNTGNVDFTVDNMIYEKNNVKLLKKHLIAQTPDWTGNKGIKIKASTTNGNVNIEEV